MNRLEQFIQRSQELVRLESILETLTWDQETMMPPLGGPLRAQQRSALAAICHQKLTDPALDEILEELLSRDLDLWMSTAVKEFKRTRDRAARVPESLVRELSEACSLSYESWVRARSASDFAAFSPWLEKLLALKREEARCLNSSGGVLYEALLEDFEPGMTVAELDELFAVIRPRLSRLLERIGSSEHHPKSQLLQGDFPIDRQEEFGRKVLTSMGFDWNSGRLDRSPHPFCSGLTPQDVRITTRYSRSDFCSSLFAMIHEGGHALYEQGLDLEHYGSPACEAISMGIHESQSRLWENQVGRSRDFWKHWLGEVKEFFPGQIDEVSLEDFLHAVNRVKPSLIRVEADEVSYGLHVILRYELEKQLLEEDLEVADLEEAWNGRMKEYLGISPANSAEGVLQDTHWSQGLLGYFPTYLLGNLYAAQIYEQALGSIESLEEQISRGNLLQLRQWLGETIHRHGKTLTAPQLIQQVSGGPLQADSFLNYLETKFGELYALR